MSPDSTIAWHDLAFGLHDLGHCVLCGCVVPTEIGEAVRCRHCGEETTPWGSVWTCSDADTGQAQAIAFLLCHEHACREEHRTIEAEVDAKLRQRYGFGEHAGTAPQKTQG